MREILKDSLKARLVPILVLGLLTSLYLLHHHLELKYNYVVGDSICNINQVLDCDSVAKSKYSEVLGIPVALFGAISYCCLLLTLVIFDSTKKSIRLLLLVLSTVFLIPTILMALISFFEIGKVCLFCLLIYLLNITVFGLLHYFTKSDGNIVSRLGQGFLALLSVLKERRGLYWVFGNLGAVLFLYSLQPIYVELVLRPRYESYFDKVVINNIVEDWKKSEKLFEREEVESIGGIIRVGNPKAKFQLVELSDFECPFCQRVAPVLKSAIEKYSNDLEIVLLNYPLDKSCNKAMPQDLHEFSCELSRLVIAKTMEKQKAGFELHEKIMSENLVTEGDVKTFQKEIYTPELNMEQVEKSLQDQISFGIKHEVGGTPTIFINGRRLTYKSFYQIEGVINQIVSDNP